MVMAEYIEREAAIKATCFNCSEKAICGGVCDDTDRIRSIPAADVRPVVRGKWLHKEITDDFHAVGQCSVCKERRRIDNFCPNCGAMMEES